jgi:hypothetical protein
MSILEILAWILPLVSFGVLGFADTGGGDGDGDGNGGGDDDGDGNGAGDGDDKTDPSIKEIMGSPDSVKDLLEKKRAANAEAKKYRLQLEKVKKDQAEADAKKLKDQEKYKELSEKLQGEKETAEGKFKTQVVKLALRIEASKQGITDPDLIDLIDTSDVKISEDYEVENAAEVITAFKEKKPNFFKKEGDDDDDDQGNKGPEDRKPDLHSKVKGTKEGLTPDQRISSYFQKKKK